MPRLTAIEFSEDTCVVVRVSTRGTSTEVTGVDILDPAAFSDTESFTDALRQLRTSGRFPRRARVVLWGLEDGAVPSDPGVSSRLEPIVNAGFRIERVVSPCNALAVLARIRVPKPESATIWLAVDPHGVAIVAVRPGELLYSHALPWDSSIGAVGSQARLLQRYSLVSFLAPHVRRAMDVARGKAGGLDAVVICGTFPDLRSLTMPLIEELDIEVETLDSLSGLIIKPSLRERLTELAPVIRIACAGALARPTRPRRPMVEDDRRPAWLPLAAALTLIAIAVIAGLLLIPRYFRSAAQGSRSPDVRVARESPKPQPPMAAPASRPREVPQSQPVRPPAPEERTQPTSGRSPSTPPRVQSRDAKPLHGPSSRADTSRSRPLKDPLPHVTTILVSADRRFAMVDGRIVSVGDRVGQRTVTAIEPHVVVFREPSGVQIRVGLGGRLAPEGRVDP